MKRSLPLLFGLLLTACSGLGPEGSVAELKFLADPPYSVVDHSNDSHQMIIVLDGDQVPGIQRAALFIGAQRFEAERSDPYAISVPVFTVLTDRCRNIQQGDNVPVRYEMYDAQGTVVQQRAISVQFSTCP